MTIEVWLDAVPLTTIAPWGELEWSHAADGGCKDASFKVDVPATFSHPALTRGALVEIKAGSANLWAGFISEPDPDDDWTVNCLGLSAAGRDYLCLDSGGNTTSTPNTAVDRAITDGIGWTRPTSLSSAPFAAGDVTDKLNRVGDLLDAWADNTSQRWGVNADGQVYADPDPTVPTWHLTPGSGRFGLADDDYASDLYVRYLKSGAGYATAHVADATARARFGRREHGVDATVLGLLSAGAATTFGNGLLAKGKARQGYTNGVTVSKAQLTTPGGQPAYLPFVKAGQLARMFGVSDEQGQPVNFVDFVIGETKYTAGADTIELTPVGLVARDLEGIIAGTAAA